MSRHEFEKNMVLSKQNRIVRILVEKETKVLVIDCKKIVMPTWIEKEELNDYVEIEYKPECELYEMLTSEERKIAHHRFTMIAPVLPFVSDEKKRAKTIAFAADEAKISKKTIRKYLCQYLIAQDIGGLAPKRKNQVQKKLSKDEKNYRWALNKFYYNTNENSLQTAYRMMLKEKYCDSSGKLYEKFPTYYQFRYFYRKYNKMQNEIISRKGLSCYQRNYRPLIGDGVQQFAPGIGVGMLDSTICDIYLINGAGEIVGRPILTACIDAYSGLCCGYAISWEGGVYSLRDLMLNVITDKKKHCSNFNIQISEEEWPSKELPAKIVTDKGSEYKSQNFEQLSDLGVSITNLPAYRPELKGPVEKFFDVIQGYYKPYLKGRGVIDVDYQQRGGHDYRKDACITLNDFEKIIVHCIVFYNSKRILENFPYTNVMLENGIKPYANEIWKWGSEQEEKNLITVSKEELVKTLLPRTKGRFTRNGLYVNGLHYHNIQYNEQYLQGKDAIIAYNPENVSTIWLLEKGNYIDFKLIEQQYMEQNLTDVLKMRNQQKEINKMERNNRLQAELELAEHIQVIANRYVNNENVHIKNIRKTRKKEVMKEHKDFIWEVENE